MEVIDEGGFGCVIQPALNCTNGKNTRKNKYTVSKLQSSKYAKYEMSQINKVKKICKKVPIPNWKDYTVLDVKICNPNIPKNIINENKCPYLDDSLDSSYLSSTKSRSLRTLKKKKTRKNVKILNFPFMGKNLHRCLIDKYDFGIPSTFVKINNSIINLYKNFIMILNKNNFYHNDIKATNILVGKDEKYRLIDYGISNRIIFSHIFIFNKPYIYILLSNYFLDKIEILKKTGNLTYEKVKEQIVNYLELIKISKSSDYNYTKEILEYLYPNVNSSSEIINPVLLECLIQTSLRFNTDKEWIDIYMHNLDIVGIALIYPDILCAIAIKKKLNLKIQQGIVSFYTKYVIECYTKIDREEFIEDLNKLNMLVV